MFGKQSKVGPQERMNEFSYTGKNGDEYTLVEDISTGDAQITKDKMGGVLGATASSCDFLRFCIERFRTLSKRQVLYDQEVLAHFI